MCGRFLLIAPGRLVAEQFQLDDEPDVKPRYNIAPSQSVAAVRLAADSEDRELRMLKWGLIPFWAKDPKIGYRTINAKSETVAEKPAFRAAFKHRRCLVPADGFYEWKREKGKKQKQPYLIRMKGGSLFAFAGLWEYWKSADGDVIESCTILTTDSNEFVGSLHDRMPVILHREDYELWLDSKVKDANTLSRLFKPFPAKTMEIYPVSLRVNKAQNDDPDLIHQM